MTQIFSPESGAHLQKGEIAKQRSWSEKLSLGFFGFGLLVLIVSTAIAGVENYQLASTLDIARADLVEVQREQVSSLSGSQLDGIDEFDVLLAIEKEKQAWGLLIQDIQAINSKGEIEIKSISGSGNTVEVGLRSLNSKNYSLTAAAKFADKLRETDKIKDVNIPSANKITHAGNLAESQIILQAVLN